MDYSNYMKIALEKAKEGILLGEQPYGALLIADGKIVCTAHNEVKSTNNELNHAEIVVINKYLETMKEKPRELTLITTCEPCLKCFGLAIKLGVNNFVYGSNIETAIKYNSGDMLLKIKDFQDTYNFSITGCVLENECDELLKDFYEKNNLFNLDSYGTEEERLWMKRALEIGKKGMLEKHELPIGVVLVAGKDVLSETCTLTYTMNSPITHGDFMALMQAERKVFLCDKPLVLYSSLEPHLLGFGAAIKCKVDKVVYGLEAIPDGGACYLQNMIGIKENIPKIVGGVCRDEQYQLMKEFIETHEEKRVGYDYAKKLVYLYENGKRK